MRVSNNSTGRKLKSHIKKLYNGGKKSNFFMLISKLILKSYKRKII